MDSTTWAVVGNSPSHRTISEPEIAAIFGSDATSTPGTSNSNFGAPVQLANNGSPGTTPPMHFVVLQSQQGAVSYYQPPLVFASAQVTSAAEETGNQQSPPRCFSDGRISSSRTRSGRTKASGSMRSGKSMNSRSQSQIIKGSGKPFEEAPVVLDYTKKQLIVNFVSQQVTDDEFRDIFSQF